MRLELDYHKMIEKGKQQQIQEIRSLKSRTEDQESQAIRSWKIKNKTKRQQIEARRRMRR